MEYYKSILFVDGEKLRITPDQFQGLKAAQGRGDKYLNINGNMVTLSSISRTEDTFEPVPTSHALPGIVATDKPHQHRPIMVQGEGNYPPGVKSIMVKKRYPQKYYDKWLAHSSFARLLETDGSWVWVAQTHVPCKDCGITIDGAIELDHAEYTKITY